MYSNFISENHERLVPQSKNKIATIQSVYWYSKSRFEQFPSPCTATMTTVQHCRPFRLKSLFRDASNLRDRDDPCKMHCVIAMMMTLLVSSTANRIESEKQHTRWSRTEWLCGLTSEGKQRRPRTERASKFAGCAGDGFPFLPIKNQLSNFSPQSPTVRVERSALYNRTSWIFCTEDITRAPLRFPRHLQECARRGLV